MSKNILKMVVTQIRPFALFCIVLVGFVVACGFERSEVPKEAPKLGVLPSSAEILFASTQDIKGGRRKEIYSMDANGNNITRITFSGKHHFIFDIDSSRRYLVVTRAVENTSFPPGLGDEDGKSIWLIDLTAKEEIPLTDLKNQAETDSFSPDGEWVVFWMMLAGDKQSDIYKIKKDGTNLTRLTHTKNISESDPEWSNNGDKIAYISYGSDSSRFVLKVMDANGNNVKTVYDSGENISTPRFPPGVYDPSWSPDDQWIVFDKPAVEYNGENGKAGIWHICKIRSDGSELINLSKAGGHTDRAEYLPHFSEDGESIVFSTRYGSKDPSKVNIDVFKMDKNGSSLQRLTSHPAYEDGATWIRGE